MPRFLSEWSLIPARLDAEHPVARFMQVVDAETGFPVENCVKVNLDMNLATVLDEEAMRVPGCVGFPTKRVRGKFFLRFAPVIRLDVRRAIADRHLRRGAWLDA